MPLEISLRGIFRIVLIAMAVLLGWAYFTSDGSPYMDIWSWLLSESLILFLYWSTGEFSNRHSLAWVVTYVVSAQVCLRLVSLFFRPDWLFGFGAPSLNSAMFNQLLVFIGLGTLACYGGIASGDWIARGLTPARERSSDSFPFFPLTIIFLVILGLHYLNFIIFGYGGASGSGETLNFFSRYVLRALDPLTVLCMSMVAYFWGYEHRGPFSRRWYWFLWLAYFAYTTLIGGRSGYYEIVAVGIAVASVFNLSLPVRLSIRNICIGLVLLLSIPPLFVYSTKLRATQWYSTTIVAEFENMSDLIQGIFQRVNLIEQTLHPMFAKELGYNDVSDLVNVKTTIQSALNRFIPGRPFGDVPFSEFAFGFLYKKEGVIIERVSDRVDFIGYEWGMYGISHQLFGYFGGILFMFFFTGLLAFGVRLLIRRNSFRSYSFAILLAYATYVWVRNLGLDNLFDRIGHTALVMFFLIALFSMAKSIARGVTVLAWDGR